MVRKRGESYEAQAFRHQAWAAHTYSQEISLQNLSVQHLEGQVTPLALTDSQREPQP